MFLEYLHKELQHIEDNIAETMTRDELLEQLRFIGLDDFGLLLFSLPNPQYPQISRLLPKMADAEVQLNWTGASGLTLLIRTLDFVRSVASNFSRFTGHSLHNKTMLDFGCGYGRIARLMYHYTNSSNLIGVDPWNQSIQVCKQDGMGSNFLQSSYLPVDLPVAGRKFELIYAFSVFTHLSEKATRLSFQVLLDCLADNGLLVITIRPVEYWNVDILATQLGVGDQQVTRHRQNGFAFLPHDREAVDGDITYGDTSMSLEWLKASFPAADVLAIDRSLNDPYQLYVYIKRKSLA
jgi:SAM-dependent methyltransferase